ncbi:zinc-finger domain-containing protein [Cantharellus anzutake]|uniref:zinc-finger domain-containing protein n=1 Tax=Cantharellus anzutake TaxID=1750568 RepID=UPI00190866BE|nr:zinc-finger domain-containing protein [Cantharellus anzutake]KAF8337419.1 zinc-finger domain-containing protein [Cantharellus anzutake]
MLPKLRSLPSVRFTKTLASSTTVLGSSVPLPPIPGPVESVPQAPDRLEPWSTSQQLRPPPKSSPRFEQIAQEYQPTPQSAMEMVNSQPIILSDARIAVCDGGGGPLGHPKIFINLDKPGPRPCGYCGLRFQRAHHHH